jgi:hypothetical protein
MNLLAPHRHQHSQTYSEAKQLETPPFHRLPMLGRQLSTLLRVRPAERRSDGGIVETRSTMLALAVRCASQQVVVRGPVVQIS